MTVVERTALGAHEFEAAAAGMLLLAARLISRNQAEDVVQEASKSHRTEGLAVQSSLA